MAFPNEVQKLAGVPVKQAPVLLHSHLAGFDSLEILTLARDIVLLTVVSPTNKRSSEWFRTLKQAF